MGKNSELSIRTKRKHMTELAAYRDQTLRKQPKLHSLFLELTGACNEHCLHCGSNCGEGGLKDSLSTEEIKSFLRKTAQDFDVREIRLCITGGEPLLHPDFFEIMNYAKSLGYLWGMTSNGTLITKEVAQKLKTAGMQTVSISVDGIGPMHDWFRQSKGSYEKTLQGIRNLLEVGFMHVQITTVVYHKNIGQLQEMYEEFSNVGVRSWRVVNIEPIGRAKTNPELMLSPQEYRQMFDFIEEKRFAGKMEVCYGCSHYLGEELEREVRTWYFLCNAGVYTASIMYNGNIAACLDIERRPELIQGNIRKDSFKDVWENKFEIYRNDFRKTGKCKDCPDYNFCAADSFHTWDFEKMEPALCMKGILF